MSTPGRARVRPNHPSPARGEIIKPGVSTPGGDTRPPKPSEPRKGRDHKARRVNAGAEPDIRAPQGRDLKPASRTIRAPQGARSPFQTPQPRKAVIKPGVSTPGRDTRPPKPSEPRKGRDHKARRVNAGGDTRPPKPSEPRKGRHQRARRVNAGGSTPCRPNHPSPARGEIIKPGVFNAGRRHATGQTTPAPQGATS